MSLVVYHLYFQLFFPEGGCLFVYVLLIARLNTLNSLLLLSIALCVRHVTMHISDRDFLKDEL
jgi:Na+/pantothenate symporter